MVKNKKSKWKKRILVLLFTAMVLFGTGLLFVREDWRFMITQEISAAFRNISFQEVSFSADELQTISIEELLSREDVQREDSLILVNAQSPIENRSFSLEEYKDSGLLMNSCILDHYSQLSAAVLENTGEKLYVNNSYRSREEQEEVFAEEGDEVSARPGESEHETGLALDVYVSGFAGTGFIKSKAGQFIATQGWKYGFIIRYPRWKTSQTGISYEPWHIRYLGEPHAKILYYKNWCLEEYYEHLEVGNFYLSENFFITRQSEQERIQLPKNATQIVLSDDNMGNWVITGTYETEKNV